jgi:hypothetical protein
MTNPSGSEKQPDDSSERRRPAKPKRGAFPTPQSEIDKAQPYIPDLNQAAENPEAEEKEEG